MFMNIIKLKLKFEIYLEKTNNYKCNLNIIDEIPNIIQTCFFYHIAAVNCFESKVLKLFVAVTRKCALASTAM